MSARMQIGSGSAPRRALPDVSPTQPAVPCAESRSPRSRVPPMAFFLKTMSHTFQPMATNFLSLVEGRQRLAVIVAQFADAAFLHLLRPFRILQQGPADGDQVELAAREALFKIVQ